MQVKFMLEKEAWSVKIREHMSSVSRIDFSIFVGVLFSIPLMHKFSLQAAELYEYLNKCLITFSS
jgi:hypothetical protein